MYTLYTPSTLLVSSAVKVQVSLPYNRMRMLSTTAVMRRIFSLLEKLDVQIKKSLLAATQARALLTLKSFIELTTQARLQGTL